MDRERLKEVHQTDLTESRVNEEFVDWLKTKGVSWLLVLLIALCAYLAVVRWKQSRINHRVEAWTAFQESDQSRLPSSYEEVADTYADVGGIAHLSRIRAATRLLQCVQSGRPLGAEATATGPGATLTQTERTEYLDRIDRLCTSVVEEDDESLAMTLLVVSAINGQAAVAESRGEVAEADRLYRMAADRARAYYPGLTEQAEKRAETVGAQSQDVTLIATPPTPTPRPGGQRITLEPTLRDLLLVDDDDG